MMFNAGWSSLVARRAHNPKVVGSNPSPATKFQGAVHRELSLFLFLLQDRILRSITKAILCRLQNMITHCSQSNLLNLRQRKKMVFSSLVHSLIFCLASCFTA